eukprot:Polyplicarium_translucidae@DN694_c0_g1_i2.p1
MDHDETSPTSPLYSTEPPDALLMKPIISESVQQLIADVKVKSAVQKLKEGTFLIKYCQNSFSKPHERMFWVDMEVLAIKWESPKKNATKTTISLTDVDRIVPGEESDFWRGKNKSAEERALGIELLSPVRRLRLVCSNQEQWKTWMKGLLYAHQKAITKRKRAASLTNDFIRQQWEQADLDQSGSIQPNELIHLLQKLNCRADVRYAEQLFDSFDMDGSRVLEYDEFKNLIHSILTHEDILVYFEQFKQADKQFMAEDGFRAFLHEIQSMPASQVDEAAEHATKLQEPFARPEGLTNLGFNLLLSSEFNSIVNPLRAKVYQDMTQPLSSYWIATSHNTYLTGDQIMGASAVGQYVEVLLRGCRCVELDCWDGPDGDPVIYHGRTWTSKIPFEAVIKACKDYGFQRSKYPIILSLEMHCSPRQQVRIGQILTTILGNHLYVPRPGDRLLSPKELMNRFVVKCKIPDETGGLEGNEEDVMLDSEELQLEFNADFPARYPLPDVTNSLSSLFLNKDAHRLRERSARQPSPEPRSAPPKEALQSVVSLVGKRFKGFEERRQANQVCSMNERLFVKAAKANPTEFVRFCQNNLVRVYPSSTRLLSSNMNPMEPWTYGAQFVALNYQARGLSMLTNHGRFVENGQCGYILKPPLLRNSREPFDPSNASANFRTSTESPMELSIRVLAAQQVPRPSSDQKFTSAAGGTGRRRDVACPYVVVSIQGARMDSVSRRTYPVTSNGLNPRWKNQVFHYDIMIPSLAILTFEVRHYDAVKNEFLAAAALPVGCARTGLRWVPLYDARFREIPWSGILVHAAIRPSKRTAVRPPGPGAVPAVHPPREAVPAPQPLKPPTPRVSRIVLSPRSVRSVRASQESRKGSTVLIPAGAT